MTATFENSQFNCCSNNSISICGCLDFQLHVLHLEITFLFAAPDGPCLPLLQVAGNRLLFYNKCSIYKHVSLGQLYICSYCEQ